MTRDNLMRLNVQIIDYGKYILLIDRNQIPFIIQMKPSLNKYNNRPKVLAKQSQKNTEKSIRQLKVQVQLNPTVTPSRIHSRQSKMESSKRSKSISNQSNKNPSRNSHTPKHEQQKGVTNSIQTVKKKKKSNEEIHTPPLLSKQLKKDTENDGSKKQQARTRQKVTHSMASEEIIHTDPYISNQDNIEHHKRYSRIVTGLLKKENQIDVFEVDSLKGQIQKLKIDNHQLILRLDQANQKLAQGSRKENLKVLRMSKLQHQIQLARNKIKQLMEQRDEPIKNLRDQRIINQNIKKQFNLKKFEQIAEIVDKYEKGMLQLRERHAKKQQQLQSFLRKIDEKHRQLNNICEQIYNQSLKYVGPEIIKTLFEKYQLYKLMNSSETTIIYRQNDSLWREGDIAFIFGNDPRNSNQ